MNGGLGNDTYIVDNVGDTVTETSAVGGTDEVQSSATFTLGSNIENLVLTGVNAINGTGNSLANNLTGNAAANILDGGVGADTMTGGLGNDTYVIDNVGDVAIELAGEGTDTIQTTLNHTLATDFENLILTGTGNVNGTGNGLANMSCRQSRRQHARRRRRRRHHDRRPRQRHLRRRQWPRPGDRSGRRRHRHGQQLDLLHARRRGRESDPDRHRARSTAPAMRSPTR